MNRRTALFEIGTIIALLLMGFTLSFVSIDNTGILSVAALLSVFFAASHYKAIQSFAMQRSSRQPWSGSPISSSES